MAATVSICVPTYNGARYLRACLDSAQAQTFEDYELLVIDDGSTDATLDLVHRYAAADTRIKVWRNDRTLGLVANWNRCVAQARGEWVKFLFQDDVLEPPCLERMLQASRGGVDLVVARRELIFEAGTPGSIQDRYLLYLAEHDLARHCRGKDYLDADQFAAILLEAPGWNCIGEPTATLIRRSAFDRYGGFNPDLVILSDWEYCARLAANTGLCYVGATMAHFRVHAGGASAAIRSRRAYRSEVIDPCVIVHELCYSAHYAGARDVALRLEPPVDLRARLAESVRSAIAQAWTGRYANVKSEWWSTLRRYPRLAGSALRSALRS